jgi:phage/plasmid-associated DNA primase
MLLTTGYALVERQGTKGRHVYLHGGPNTGKSTLVEHFFVWLYGIHNIGIVGSGNFKLELLLDKEIIIINEFKYRKYERELNLKLFDRSIIEIQQKHKTNISYQITQPMFLSTNLTLKEQGFDKPLRKRFIPLELTTTFEELGIAYNNIVAEFPFILYNSIYLYLACKHQQIGMLDAWVNKMKINPGEISETFQSLYGEASLLISPNKDLHLFKNTRQNHKI